MLEKVKTVQGYDVVETCVIKTEIYFRLPKKRYKLKEMEVLRERYQIAVREFGHKVCEDFYKKADE